MARIINDSILKIRILSNLHSVCHGYFKRGTIVNLQNMSANIYYKTFEIVLSNAPMNLVIPEAMVMSMNMNIVFSM